MLWLQLNKAGQQEYAAATCRVSKWAGREQDSTHHSCHPFKSSPLPTASLPLLQYFEYHGVEYKLLILPTCEENKELHLVTTIAEAIEDFKINRSVSTEIRTATGLVGSEHVVQDAV